MYFFVSYMHDYVYRFSRENMLLCGMWFDREKPSMTTFIKPIIEQINKLYLQGTVHVLHVVYLQDCIYVQVLRIL